MTADIVDLERPDQEVPVANEPQPSFVAPPGARYIGVRPVSVGAAFADASILA